MTEYTWHGIRTPSVERLSVSHDADIQVASVVETEGQRYTYSAALSADWVFETLNLQAGDGRTLTLTRHRDGVWHVNGRETPELSPALDIDLSCSPFTNTLPFRRLNLPVGASADIAAAYVETPALRVFPDPQRYTRLAVDRYRFDSLDSDFSCDITVDSDGFVLEYPGLFRRG